MSTEPLDEFPAAPAETRGGDHFADINAVDISLYPQTKTVASSGQALTDDDLSCDCGCEDAE
jgi:hypothetical protein